MSKATVLELVTALLVVAGLTAAAYTLEAAQQVSADLPALQALQSLKDEAK